MAELKFVKKARKDYPEFEIKRGDSYWWWQFRFEKKRRMSKHKPKRSALTQSDYQGQVWDIEDLIQEISNPDEIFSAIELIKSLRNDQQRKRDNMPESLQNSKNGDLLQERCEALDHWIKLLESVDLEDEDALDQLRLISCE